VLAPRNVGGKVGLKENLGWGHSGSGTTAKTVLSIDVGSLPCQSSYSNGDLMFFDYLDRKKAEFFQDQSEQILFQLLHLEILNPED
jgi:hypothetical protein